MPKRKIKIYKLTFHSGFHLDSQAYAYENSRWMIPSDTLFSAICQCYLMLYGKESLEIMLNNGNPAFKISSCFPFKGKQYYFPTPMKSRSFSDKKLLKASLMPLESFEQDLNAKVDIVAWEKSLLAINHLYSEVERPRVIVDRINNSSSIFHFVETQYDDNAGLYCMVDYDDSSLEKSMLAALRLLGEEGIGSDSTVGKGQFSVTEDELFIETPNKGEHYLLLSLYNPSDAEVPFLKPDDSYYKYIVRGGWITTGGRNLRRKSVRMLTEGSIVKYVAGKPPVGTMPVVLEDQFGLDHPVYRYGKAFCLPITL